MNQFMILHETLEALCLIKRAFTQNYLQALVIHFFYSRLQKYYMLGSLDQASTHQYKYFYTGVSNDVFLTSVT